MAPTSGALVAIIIALTACDPAGPDEAALPSSPAVEPVPAELTGTGTGAETETETELEAPTPVAPAGEMRVAEGFDGQPSAAPAVQPVVGEVVDDDRQLHQLVTELIAVQAIGDRDERDVALSQLAVAWRGHRYQWELGVVPVLCPSAERCNLMPFDVARFERPPVQGWLPRTAFADPGQHEAMLEACEPYEYCVIRVESVLTELDLSVERPTALGLAEVRFLGARAQAEGEVWFRR